MDGESTTLLEGMDALVGLADDLANSLSTYQSALAHLMHGNAEAMRRRIQLLMLLASEAEVRQDHAEAMTNVPNGEITQLDHLGVIKRRHARIKLTSHGENILTMLLFFRGEMDGAMSEGFAAMVAAAQAGGLDPTMMGKILKGSAERYAATMKAAAASGSIIEVERQQTTRQRGSGHVRHILSFIGGSVDAFTISELESAAVDLHGAYIEQDASHVQMHRENIELPHGVTHRHLLDSLRRHSPEALMRLIAERGVLRRLPRPSVALQFDGDIGSRFTESIVEVEQVEALPIEAASEGVPSLKRNWQRLKDSLEDASDGAALHEVAVDVHAYLSGVYHALRGRLPRRMGLPDVHLEILDERIQTNRIGDGPLILIRRNP